MTPNPSLQRTAFGAAEFKRKAGVGWCTQFPAPLEGPATARALRAASVKRALTRMNFTSTSLAFISPVQIYTLNDFTSAGEVAAQILLQRDLLAALSDWQAAEHP